GPLTQLTWGNGLTLSRTYDQDYQLTTQIIGNWQNQYGFDPVGNITSQQSNLWGAVQYQYDALNRLTREQSATTQKDYTLDAVGNRTQRTTTDLASGTISETQTATVATDSNRLATVEGLTLPYDTAGNLQQNTTGLRYTYDDSGRMNAVYQAGTLRIASFTYNNLGQRTLKLTYDPVSSALVSGSTYLYGPGGEVIGQADYGASGQRLVTRFWIWLDGMPLAQVELNYTQGVPSGFQLVYLHSDHLNTPRLASTHQGIVWSWISDAYGAALPNEDVAGSGTATHIPLRFPGQFYDAQTQLSYNYYRDYDANLGRYVQSDPIGLAGGGNSYAYVDANPLSFSDPYGLAPSISGIKAALRAVYDLVGGQLPKGEPGKFGSPQAGDSKKGYRLDPGHPNRPEGDPEAGPHINWWDYTNGKRGSGGKSGVEKILDGIVPFILPPGFEEACQNNPSMWGCPVEPPPSC
ncbi:RHS repeat protein, partial [Pseudomonas sp. MWU13-2860]